MKALTLLATASLIFASGVANAQIDVEIADGDKRSNVQWEFQDKIASQFDVSLPHVEGRDFRLLSLGFSSDFYLGCDGFTAGRIDKQMVAEMKAMVKYVKNNALGLVINYLIYESPTLYSIYEHLQTLRQFNINSSIASCSQIRALATKEREKEIGQAKEQCVKDGNAIEECEDAGTLDYYFNQILSNQETARSELTGGKGGNPDDVLIAQVTGDNPEEKELRDWLDKVVPPRDTGGGTLVQTQEQKPIADYMQDQSAKYLQLLETVVRTPAKDRPRSQALAKIEADHALKQVPPGVYAQLERDLRTRPSRYFEGVGLLARTMTLNDMRYKIAQVKLLAARNKLLVGDNAMSEEDLEYLEDTIVYLESQFALYETRYENEARQFAVEAALTSP